MRPVQRLAGLEVQSINMTEGPVLPAYREADLLILQETDFDKVRAGFPADTFRGFYPSRDPHQAIVWRRSRFRPVDLDGQGRRKGWVKWTKFHGSGSGDAQIPDSIATPRRGMLEVALMDEQTGALVMVMGTWLINSWRWGGVRKWIALTLSFPKIRRRIREAHKRGFLVILAGDLNNTVFRFAFAGTRCRPKRGLDRVIFSRSKALRLEGISHGPKTGAGNDMRHESLVARFTIAGPGPV